MTRACMVLLSAFALAGAGQPPALPVPPIPPLHPPSDQPAPMPNADARAPPVLDQQGAQLSPSIFLYNNYDRSLGYAPGSRVQTSDDRKIIPAPGLTLRVPIQ